MKTCTCLTDACSSDFPLAQAALFKMLGILDIFITHEKLSEPVIEQGAENDASWGAVVPSQLPPVELQVLPPDVGA